MDKINNRAECVNHFPEGRSAWKYGVVNFFIRIRGIALSVVILTITMGVPWWWPSDFPKYFTFNSKILLFVSLFSFSAIFVALLLYLRFRTIRSLDIKANIHNMAHYLRDYQIEVFQEMDNIKKDGNRSRLF